MKELNKVKKTAVAAALEAGAELLRRYQKFSRSEVMLKSHHEILTKADLAAEKIIISQVRSAFPDHHILSEESGESGRKSDWLWVIDPLDGTTNFSMHNPLWAVSIGVAYQGQPVVGVVFAPFANELFVAESGKGAKLNGKKIEVSSVKEGKVLNAFCHGRKDNDIRKAVSYFKKQKIGGLDCRQMGSASIELAFVAAGRLETMVIPGALPWDVAAGILLVREAGGKVTDFSSNEWSLESKDMAASNRIVHEQMMKTLSAC